MAAAAAACFALTAVSTRPALNVVKPAAYIVSQGHHTSPCAPQVCYSAGMLQQAYDFPANLTGAGQTILIVVPYGSPTIADDLAQFDSTFGIPAPPSFTTVTGAGAGGTGSGDTLDWSVETSAGVELAHANAPGAAIVLVVSPTDDTSDVVATEQQFLPQYPGAIVSQSFGDDETDPTAQADFAALHDVFTAATSAGGTIVASAGDFGANDCPDPSFGCASNPPVASYPASDPLVTGVGGTEGDPFPDGLLKKDGKKYGNEQVWNENDAFAFAATGGAPSVLFDTPDYQAGVTGVNGRAVPDVAYNAALNGGVEIYDSDPELLAVGAGPFLTFGGTSAGPPQWAGIFALADQARASASEDPLGVANTALYAIARSDKSYKKDFHDIRKGNNALLPGAPGFRADKGYDLATGLGTPDVANLVGDLVTGPSDHKGPGGHPHPKPGPPGPGGPHHVEPDR